MLYTDGLFTLGGILLLFVFIVGCCVLLEDTQIEEIEVIVEPEPEPEKPREVLPFSLMLDWYPNVMHAFLYSAVSQGFFEEEDLEVEIKYPALTYDAISMSVEEEVDAGIYYMQDTIAAAINTNVPVASFGAVVQGDLNVVASLADSGIEGPQDLELKRIGYARSALSESMIIAMMDSVGVSVRECEFIDVGFDLVPALINGVVDATIGNLINHDIPLIESKGQQINYFYPIDFGCPNMHELVFIANKDRLNNNKDKYLRFLNACRKGFEYVKEHQSESIQLIIDHQIVIERPDSDDPIRLYREVEEQSLELLLPAMELVQDTFLQQETRIWQETADWMYNNKIIESRHDIDILGLAVNLFDMPDEKEDEEDEEAQVS